MLLKKIPFPIAGLMLGLAALGNLLMSYSVDLRYGLGAMSFVLFLLIAAKLVSSPGELKSAFEQPVVASTAPTFSMGMAILAAYLRPHMPQAAIILWFAALGINVALMIAFSRKYLINFSIKKVFPSWFVVYVGIAVFSVTAPAFGQRAIGQAAFWFAFVSYFAFLPIVLYRMVSVKGVPDPALPTIAIFTAPSSLALAGYLNSFPDKNVTIVSVLTIFSLVSLAGVMLQMPRLLKLPFFPSYSCFTFPFVITGIALKGASKAGVGAAFLGPIIPIFELWALVMVLYVLWRYIAALASAPIPAQPLSQSQPTP
jgi:exfoliative toxin A/B